MQYMQHVGAIDPTSPMGYVGSLSEIEQAMEQHHLHPSPGGKGGKGGRRRRPGKKGGASPASNQTKQKEAPYYPELDEQRALRGLGGMSSSSSSSSSSAAASRRRKTRRRPASAGRMRHSASAPEWHTSVRAEAANKQSGGRRMRRSGSAAVLTSMTNNLQYGSGPGTLGNGGGQKRMRLKEIRQRAKQLEQGWNQTFAQNLVSNQMIMGSTEEVGASRRRDWMNHHADQFSALNELRRAILQNREGGGGGGSSIDVRGRSSRKSKSRRSKPNANASTPNKKRVIRKLAKKKTKNKKNKQQASTKNLMLVDKTRMQSRRLQKKSKGATSTPQLAHGHGNDVGGNDTSEDDSDLHQGYAGDDGFDEEEVKVGAELGEEDALSKARHLSEMRFVKQCKAVRILFEDLKVPQRDRRFFTKTFMARYDERCAAFVQEQAELLDGHRRRTLRVLSRIRRREMAIKQLHAVAKACVTGIVPSMETKSHGQGGSAEIASMKVKHRKRFRAILEDAARRAQTASCLVVEAIVPWRKDLWRPQPFKWKGKNYILRMGNCVGLQKFVTNADYVRAIRMCELPAGTLDVLLPPNVCEELCVNTHPPRVMVAADEGKDKSEKDDAAAVVAAEAAAESPSPAGDHERMSSVRINAACMVIQQEPQVVKELREELDELVEKGYFIPRLRWNPNKLQSESQGEQGI